MNKDLAYIKLMLEDIFTIADKVTSGNVSHNIATIKCDARKALECIASMQEEPVNDYLEKAALLYYPKMSRISEPHGIILADNESHYLGDANEDNRKAFKAGANWQKQQMMAKAVKGTARPDDNEIWCNLASSNLKDDDKVKVIVIKEE